MIKLETEFNNLKQIGGNHDTYTARFHELSLLVPHVVTPASRGILKYTLGLPLQVQSIILAQIPTTLSAAIIAAAAVTESFVTGGVLSTTQSKKDQKNKETPTTSKTEEHKSKKTKTTKKTTLSQNLLHKPTHHTHTQLNHHQHNLNQTCLINPKRNTQVLIPCAIIVTITILPIPHVDCALRATDLVIMLSVAEPTLLQFLPLLQHFL
jgi:hypothetical protein